MEGTNPIQYQDSNISLAASLVQVMYRHHLFFLVSPSQTANNRLTVTYAGEQLVYIHALSVNIKKVEATSILFSIYEVLQGFKLQTEI